MINVEEARQRTNKATEEKNRAFQDIVAIELNKISVAIEKLSDKASSASSYEDPDWNLVREVREQLIKADYKCSATSAMGKAFSFSW